MSLPRNTLQTLVLSDRHRRFSDASLVRVKTEVEGLSRLFAGIPREVYLVGGVGLALQTEGFYRNHRDFDLCVFPEDLSVLAEHLDTRGHELVFRHFAAHISPWHNLQGVSPLDPVWAAEQDPESLRIRAIKKGRGRFRYIRSRVDFLDILLHRRTPEGIALFGIDITVPWEDFLPAKRVNGAPGLLVPNVNYFRYLPINKPKKQLDFDVTGLAPISSGEISRST